MIYLPGDVLLYSRNGFFGRLIKMKTWSRISHCEVVYSGGSDTFAPSVVASRNGQGVEAYPFSHDQLVYVLRPVPPVDIIAAMNWFNTVRGQKYDWLGLMAFFAAKWQGKDNGRMFCSEFVTRFLRAGGFDPFNGYDADGIAPSDLFKSAPFKHLDVANV